MRTVRERLPLLVVSLAAGFGAIAVSYAVSGSTPTFVVSPIERWLSRSMPGGVVIFAIETFGSLGQQLNLLLATLLTAALFGGLAAVAIAVGRRAGSHALAVPVTVVSTWLVAAVLVGRIVPTAATAIGAGLVVGVVGIAGYDSTGTVSPAVIDRRRMLSSSAAALSLGALGVGTDALQGLSSDGQAEIDREPVDAVSLNGNETTGDATGSDESESVPQLSVEEYKRRAREQSLSLPGIEPLLSEHFYTVDVNAIDPSVDRATWTLSVTGAVENEFELTYDDLREFQAENRAVTLRCVGDPLNGKKMDTAVWTGVPLGPILERAAPESDSCCVMLRAADDFYEEFPLSALRDGLLAFGMNGKTLPRAHGYPLRALIPGHWGEVNVKWLTEIEILDEPATGYWEERGWHGTGPVNTVAKLWEKGIVHEGDRVVLGGHAYAGTRGIERVEVSTDGGDAWNEATLSEALPGEDVWRQWRYEFEPSGTHEVVVRAVDGSGDVQPKGQSGVRPSGATGWVRKTVRE